MWRAALIPLLCLFALNRAHAAEIVVRTADGQVLQGEDLGTENFKLRLQTRFGLVNIPSAEIESRSSPAPGEATPPGAAPAAQAGPADDAEPRKADAPADAAPPPLEFPVPKAPNFVALQAARESMLPNIIKPLRQEIRRDIRNYADSSDLSKKKIIRQLQDVGPAAYPFIAGAYNGPLDIEVKVELLQGLAAPGRPFTATIFSEAHNMAMRRMLQIEASPPLPPPDYLSRRDRRDPVTKEILLKEAAADVMRIEEYASTAGGPFNALFLLGIYSQRYGGETVNPLLADLARDRVRLAATADLSRKGVWSATDKIMLAEQLFPILFDEDEQYRTLPRDFLKKILPPNAPKWEAPEEEWVIWWRKARLDIMKK